MHKIYLLLLFLFTLGFAQEQTPPYVEFSVTMGKVYKQGDVATIDITAKLIDPEGLIQQAVLFLNVVEIDAAKRFPQAAHLIFADATTTNDIFKIVKNGQELQAGMTTSLSFTLKGNAKPAQYSLALQLFNGDNTDPNTVKVDNRIGLRNFRFTIEAK
jgi:hypothetical protein